MFTPECENLLSVFCLDICPIQEHTGQGLAMQCHQLVTSFMDMSQVASFSFDGQYFKLGVTEELKKFGYDVQFEWDAAHRLQLAENDFRQGRKHAPKMEKLGWLESSIDFVASVISEVNFGKSFEIFLQIADEYNVDVLSFKTYSTTRFAPYVFRVFQAVWRNLQPLIFGSRKDRGITWRS